MQLSGDPDHVDVAEILQHKLYYEAESLELVITVITRYKQQSYKYVLPLPEHINRRKLTAPDSAQIP